MAVATKDPAMETLMLRRRVDAQEAALAHWRREADRDAGTITRQRSALLAVLTAPDLNSAKRTALAAVER